MFFLLLGWLSSAWASCPRSATEAEVASLAQRVFQDYREQDVSALSAHMDQALEAMRCLARPISPQTAVLLHQARGLEMSVADKGQPDRARAAFASARAIDENATLPVDIAPGPEVAIYNDYFAIPLNTEVTEGLRRARRGLLYLDSEPDLQLSQNWPSIIQYAPPSGTVAFTQYRLPGEAVASYPAWRPYRAPALLALTSVTIAGLGTYGVIYSALAENYCLVSQPKGWEGCTQATYDSDYAWGERGWILIGVGGAGLVGSGVWAGVNGQQLTVGISRRW